MVGWIERDQTQQQRRRHLNIRFLFCIVWVPQKSLNSIISIRLNISWDERQYAVLFTFRQSSYTLFPNFVELQMEPMDFIQLKLENSKELTTNCFVEDEKKTNIDGTRFSVIFTVFDKAMSFFTKLKLFKYLKTSRNGIWRWAKR